MRLHELVAASNAVAEVRGRLEKTARLADHLTRLDADEVAIAVAFLTGTLIQGRIGLGWSTITRARAIQPADAPSLDLQDVNDIFERIGQTAGTGSLKTRASLLEGLFERATAAEQEFLVRLLAGEL